MSDDKEVYAFCCGYCKTEFKHVIGYHQGTGGKHHTTATQVKCPGCGNYLKHNTGVKL